MRSKDPQKLEKIYDATLKLVAKNGLTGLTVAQISKEADVGMSAIYAFFESKEGLINQLFKKIKNFHTERIFSNINSSNDSFVKNLRNLVKNYILNRIEYYEEHFFIEQCSHSHFLDEESKLLDSEAYVIAYEFIEVGKKDFLVKNINNELLIAQMIGAANEIAYMLKSQEVVITDEIIEQIFTLCWDSIKR